MGKIDPEKREQWREDSTPPDTWQDRRILDLLDALDSTESDLRVSEVGRAFDKVAVNERAFYKARAINAERELDTLKRSESFDAAEGWASCAAECDRHDETKAELRRIRSGINQLVDTWTDWPLTAEPGSQAEALVRDLRALLDDGDAQ